MTSTDAATINEMVHLLDRTERLLVTFYYVERLTLAEIALVLDITPYKVANMLRTVRQRISSALTGKVSLRDETQSPEDPCMRARSSDILDITSLPV